MLTGGSLFLALVIGILPALLWLWFWLKEDLHPEPRNLIIASFFVGMLAVPLAIPLEGFVQKVFAPEWGPGIGALSFIAILLWAFLEEGLKLLGGIFVALRKKVNDEPVDAMVYMITVALGFAALENVLFVLPLIETGNILATLHTGNLRFIGTTLLHVLASAVVGSMLAISFYKSKSVRILFGIAGLVLATILHAFFNSTIITSDGERTIWAFLVVWIGTLGLLLIFEYVKRIYSRG
jgi:protease PrsW